MSKRSCRTALAVVVGSLLIVATVLVVLISRAISYPKTPHDGAGTDVEVEIKTGMSFPQVASMLSDKRVIENPTWFRLYAMWRGNTTNIKTRKYLIKDNLTQREL